MKNTGQGRARPDWDCGLPVTTATETVPQSPCRPRAHVKVGARGRVAGDQGWGGGGMARKSPLNFSRRPNSRATLLLGLPPPRPPPPPPRPPPPPPRRPRVLWGETWATVLTRPSPAVRSLLLCVFPSLLVSMGTSMAIFSSCLPWAPGLREQRGSSAARAPAPARASSAKEEVWVTWGRGEHFYLSHLRNSVISL